MRFLEHLKQIIQDWIHPVYEPDGLALSGLGPMQPPRTWERCSHCRYLVRGAHDCPATPEKVALLKFLFFRLDLSRHRQSQKQTHVEDIRETGKVLQLSGRR